MSFIITLLFLLLFIGLFIIISVLGFLRSIFSFGKHKKTKQERHIYDSEEPAPKRKIFDEKEGEYVDFEEIE